MPEPCMNCGEADADPYDLLVRSNRHKETYLCDPCHESLAQHTA